MSSAEKKALRAAARRDKETRKKAQKDAKKREADKEGGDEAPGQEVQPTGGRSSKHGYPELTRFCATCVRQERRPARLVPTRYVNNM